MNIALQISTSLRISSPVSWFGFPLEMTRFSSKVDSTMLCFRNYYQIYKSIVSFYAINMVDKFPRFKVATKGFFHYKAMFKNIVTIMLALFSPGMIVRSWNTNISPFCKLFYPASPKRIIFSKSCKKIALTRTIDSFFMNCTKFFITNRTSMNIHVNNYSICY